MPQNSKRGMNAKGRRSTTPFLRLPRPVYNSDNFRRLSPSAVKLLIDISIQYNGGNNGDLQASLNPMKSRGWNSSSTLNRARQELVYYGFIELTRQGGLGCCSLYAITWESIDPCNGKIQVPATKTPSRLFEQTRPRYQFRNIATRRVA